MDLNRPGDVAATRSPAFSDSGYGSSSSAPSPTSSRSSLSSPGSIFSSRISESNRPIVESNPPDEMCGCCRETLRSNEVVKLSSCGHMYHTVCIEIWFEACDDNDNLEHPTCPACRAPIHRSIASGLNSHAIQDMSIANIVRNSTSDGPMLDDDDDFDFDFGLLHDNAHEDWSDSDSEMQDYDDEDFSDQISEVAEDEDEELGLQAGETQELNGSQAPNVAEEAEEVEEEDAEDPYEGMTCIVGLNTEVEAEDVSELLTTSAGLTKVFLKHLIDKYDEHGDEIPRHNFEWYNNAVIMTRDRALEEDEDMVDPH